MNREKSICQATGPPFPKKNKMVRKIMEAEISQQLWQKGLLDNPRICGKFFLPAISLHPTLGEFVLSLNLSSSISHVWGFNN